MKNKLLLWDIDGTLMSCYRDGATAMNETFKRRTGNENACGEAVVGTSMDSALVDDIMKRFNIPLEEKPLIIQEFAVILKEIVTNNSKKKTLPGIKTILNILSKKDNVYMGLITSNFKVGAEIKLDSVGLKEYFTFGGFGDYPGEKWDAAADAVNQAEIFSGQEFDKDDIFVIGDTKYDIQCARSIGAKSIAVATGWMDYETLKGAEPDYLFESLENTQRFLDIVNA